MHGKPHIFSVILKNSPLGRHPSIVLYSAVGVALFFLGQPFLTSIVRLGSSGVELSVSIIVLRV